MKKIYLLFFLFSSLFLTAQDCLDFPDTIFVCNFQTPLPVLDFSGDWAYLCAESPGTIDFDYSVDGDTTFVTVSECGMYRFAYTATAPACTETDTLFMYFDDPSYVSITGGFSGSLEYEDYDCHSGGGAACNDGGATITIGGENPPELHWEFVSTGACSSQNHIPEVINPTSDDCEAEEIIIIILDSGALDTTEWEASEPYVLENYWHLYDSLSQNLLDSLPLEACQLINPGCPAICMDNPEMDGDTTFTDTIFQYIAHRTAANWYFRMGSIDIQLEDTLFISPNPQTTLRFITTPGADYYGPGDIQINLTQQYINGTDTTYGGFQGDYFPEIIWREFFDYDTIMDVRTTTILDQLCYGCGGTSTAFGGGLSLEFPDYNCPPIPLAFYGEQCYCDPPFVDVVVNGQLNCNQPCTVVEVYGSHGNNGSFEITGPTGTFGLNGDTYLICEPGFYEISYMTFNGCEAYNSFIIEEDFEEFSSEFSAEVCAWDCYYWNGESYCEPGSYEQTFQSFSNGCDSVVTLNLFLLPPSPPILETATICEGECYFFIYQDYCEPGAYLANMPDQNGCLVEYTLILIPESAPVVSTEVSNDIDCTNESATITISGDFVSVFWSDGSTSDNLTVTSGGIYDAEVFSPNGCSTHIQTTVNELSENTESFQTETICPGETYDGYSEGEHVIETPIGENCVNTLYLTVIENSVSDTQESLTICAGECVDWNNMTLCESGTYNNFIEENGCISNQTLLLTEEGFSSFDITISNEIDCENEAVTMSVPPQLGSYIWSTGEIGNEITVTSEGDYFVTYFSENNCEFQAAATVIDNSENSTSSEILYICPGECLMVNGEEICTAGNYSFVTVEGGCETTYLTEVREMYAEITPTIIPTLDCDNNQGMLYLAFNNVWSAFIEFSITYPDGSIVEMTDEPFVLNITQGGTMDFIGYYHSANGSICETYLSLEIPNNSEEITVSTGESQEISCLTGYAQPETTALDGYQYTWSGAGITSSNVNEINPQLTEAGTYNLQVTNPENGCSTTAQFTVFPQPEMEVTTAIEQAISCETGYAQPQTTVYENYNYQWSGDGINQQNQSQINPELSIVGDYSVVVTNPENGCTSSSSFIVTEMSEVTVSAAAEPTCEDASDGEIMLNVTTGMAPYLYSIDGENWQTESVFASLPTGEYMVQIQDADNCETEISSMIDALPSLPTIEAATTEFTICANEPILIDATIPDAENLQYLWSNGATNSVLTATESGVYEVEISNSCAVETLTYTVQNAMDDPENFYYVPNAFSPTGSAENQIFKAFFTKEVEDFQFRIFDRWGNLLYESINAEDGWNGNKNGQKMPIGVYIWQMSFNMEGCDEAMQRIDLAGDVLLVR